MTGAAATRKFVASRCEALKGGDRAVNCEIALTVGAFELRENKTYERWDYVDVRERGRECWPGSGGDQMVPNYTGSLDEAMALTVKAYYVVAIHEDPDQQLWFVQLGWRLAPHLKPIIVAAGKHLPAVLCAAWLLAGEA